MTERYINSEGLVGVMIAPRFGAGFDTWNDIPDLCFDKDVITMLLDNKPIQEIEDFVEEKYKHTGYVSTIGLSDVEVKWLKPGTQFFIEEYDGSESITLIENNPDIKTA